MDLLTTDPSHPHDDDDLEQIISAKYIVMLSLVTVFAPDNLGIIYQLFAAVILPYCHDNNRY